MNFENQRIVVAGGAGFVGGHLVRRLLEQGARVTVLDNFHTGSRATLAGLEGDRLSVVDHDVCAPLDMACDLVINLACPASPEHYQADPLQTWRTSVFGSANLVEMAQRHGARIVQASTSEVYGDPELHPQAETYWGNVSCTGPRACYDEGKRAAETYLLDMFREKNVDVRIARLFNTYGPGMAINDGRVVSNFVVQALRGEALTVFGDGTQTRSFCYVSDTVNGLLALAAGRGLQGQVFNIGNPDERSVLEIAELVRTLTGSAVAMRREPAAIDDPRRRCPDISRARQRLGWAPETALRDGLEMTIADFRGRLAAGAT
ncbi:NAD-dependent epimerase/dehydratase family protein [Shimia sp.]|uniref:NAD-dependent epimerase/dehydratase family protein n=1 Tax=Shimia sp. TaxID=1954381 RepID=UPI00356B30E2